MTVKKGPMFVGIMLLLLIVLFIGKVQWWDKREAQLQVVTIDSTRTIDTTTKKVPMMEPKSQTVENSNLVKEVTPIIEKQKEVLVEFKKLIKTPPKKKTKKVQNSSIDKNKEDRSKDDRNNEIPNF